MAAHTIEPNEKTLHGVFSQEITPILTIDPGDTVNFRTLDAGWGLEAPNLDGTERKKFRLDDAELMSGHALCGPVEIRGAKPGMTLAVQIGEIALGGWGWTYAGGWRHFVNEYLDIAGGDEALLLWEFDKDSNTAKNQLGHTVSTKPFMGVMGMPPPESGRHHTAPPRIWGGNLDCKELTSGTTLYLPIGVDGGLFSTGDGHAAQGDGEICVQAIECPMDKVELTFTLREDMPIKTPHARTTDSWVTFGLHENLQEATLIALEAMVDFIATKHELPRKEALALASVVVDMRITQIANGTLGVHAVLHDESIH